MSKSTTAKSVEKSAREAAREHAKSAHNANDATRAHNAKYAKQHASLIFATAKANDFERDAFNTRLHTKCAVINTYFDSRKSVSAREIADATNLSITLVRNHIRTLLKKQLLKKDAKDASRVLANV